MSYIQGTLDPPRLDPRLEVGAYIAEGNDLYEVVRRTKRQVILENCINGVCKGKVLGRVLEDKHARLSMRSNANTRTNADAASNERRTA
jgi:hypothetical protein